MSNKNIQIVISVISLILFYLSNKKDEVVTSDTDNLNIAVKDSVAKETVEAVETADDYATNTSTTSSTNNSHCHCS